MHYTLLSKEHFAEYGALARYYAHNRSGARVFHLYNNDPENVFAFCFATPPADSTGIAHILEHTVLCGSRRFPLKDPFLQLIKGSVHSFLNAMTFPDRTIYPAASALKADLFNIMKVYGDAVFHPLLQREFFMQEGHHTMVNADGTLGISGVVYNEMIGASATHDHVASEWSYRGVLPDTVYQHSSGGEPRDIPNLDYDTFVNFHRSYYDPSRALIFLYGNIPTATYLRFLHARFLSRYHNSGHKMPVVQSQPKWTAPRSLTRSYPQAQAAARQSSVTLTWLLDEVRTGYDILLAEIVSEVLIGNSGCPLYKAILDSPLGEDLSSSSGVESELKQIVFSVGIRGTEEAHADEIKALIYDTLANIVRTGLDAVLLEGTLFRVEFSMREVKTLEGLRILRRALSGWMYGQDPLATISVEQALAHFRVQLRQNSRCVEDFIQKHLLDNVHNLTLVVNPDPAHAERERAELATRLQEKNAHLTEKEKEAIVRDNARLAEIQQRAESARTLALIPRLKVRNMPKKVRVVEYSLHHQDALPVLHVPQHSSDIGYVTLAIDISHLSSQELYYIPFLATAITEMGTHAHDHVQLSQLVNRHFGGLHASAEIRTDMRDALNTKLFFTLHIKTLYRELPAAMEILTEILTDTIFTQHTRYTQILTEDINEMRSAVVPSAHIFSGHNATSTLNRIGMIQERWQGLSQLKFLKNIHAQEHLETLHKIYQKIMHSGINIAAVSGKEHMLDPLHSAVGALGDALHSQFPKKAYPATNSDDAADLGKERSARMSYSIPSGGNYVACALPATLLSEHTIGEYVAESILAYTLSTGVLWESIRMQGGAYGASASVTLTPGTLCFISYRDPHVARTIASFEGALKHAAEGGLSKPEIAQTIVALTGKENTPLSAAQKVRAVYAWHTSNRDHQLRQRIHRAYLTCSAEKVARAAKRLYDSLAGRSLAVIGQSDAIQEAQKQYRNAIPATEALLL